MPRPSCLLLLPVALLALSAAACAPQAMNSTIPTYAVGQVGRLEYGTIVGARPVNLQAPNTGVGAVTGGVAGGVIGSTIGGDWRARAVGGVLGAALGAAGGTLIEGAAGAGYGVEFVVRLDRSGSDVTVVQTNEEGFQVGERVAISLGDRARLIRAAGPAPMAPAPVWR
ncbi:glycine zipper 2TM domain-containing protein [Sabulicella rubraurantiaca]|uniref:glycine zipper 2TM domain-containing protein n=1 Tax=Sabulicella rubraurantiaca TaxID=2811429 RepID=UPI001F30E945|nr:glycine zipper 2TM domain-containing protein [Sabulicella rubraurantiaca]